MSTNKQTKPLRTLFLTLPALLLGLVLLGVLVSPSAAANPAPVGVFYVTEPEDDILPALVTISGGTTPTSPMKTTISIAISADNTLVYYDHWEDGFANDIANPTAGEIYANPGNLDGVQIWGDADTSNGAPPGFPGDVLNSGNVIIMQNDVAVPNTAATIQYDGKDKIGGTNAIAVSRMIFASGTLSVLAYANAMFPTTEWGDEYTAPVGCNTAGTQMFEYSAFSITASRNDTTVQIDADANGAFETSVVLDEGETYLEDGFVQVNCDYVRQGAKVRSTDPDKPIQVVHLTGDIGSEYASRDFNMVPDDQLSYSYWMPVGNSTNAGDTRLYIYNPSATNLFVRCESIDGPDAGTTADSWNVTIAAGAVDSTITLSDNQAVHCFAVTAAGGTTMDTSREFNGLATIDWDERTYDWGIPFLPDDALSNQALVGLGQGRDTTASNDPDDNGSPLWVTPICTTFFYVDWNNDGTPDLVDTDGNGVAETNSNNGLEVSRLQSVRLFKPGTGARDQNGARIYTREAANNTGAGGCDFAAAWGQDPRWATATAPGLDVGTTVLPVLPVEVSKNYELVDDADGNGAPSPGDTIRYLITITNIGLNTFNNVKVFDEIPDFTTYVANSTDKDISGNGTGPWTAIPDNTGFPLDVTGGVNVGNLDSGEYFLVRFDVTLNAITSPANDYDAVTNCAVATVADDAIEACADTVIDNMGQIGDTIWEDTDGDGIQDPGEPGIPGVTVTLDPPPGVDLGNGPGVPVTVVTDANGEYLFAGLPAGDYTVTVTPPPGMTNTGDPDGGNDSTADVTLGTNEVNLDQDFGYQPNPATGQIGDTIWEDLNGDGDQDPGEPGIPGVTVELDPPAGVDLGNGPGVPVTVVTDASGEYLFDNLPEGDYTVTVTPPAGMDNTGDPDGGNDSTADVSLGDGEVNLDQDFGYQHSGQIGDTIWNDLDGDGVQDLGEPGIPGVTVELDPPAGVDLGNGPGVPVTVVTDANGEYLFNNLPEGDYTITVTPPPGSTNTGDPDGGFDSTSDVSLDPGEVNLDQDFGYQYDGQIGDTIWEDLDGDGVQDAGEPGIPGVTVELDPPPGVDLGNGDGVPVTVVTDANGEYLFDNLPPADYTINVTPPAGMTNTGDPDGGNDSTADLTLDPGEVNLDQDFGFQPSGQIGDTIWNDLDGDGIQDAGEPGIPGVTVELDPPAGVDLGNGPGVPVTVVTDANGHYLFDNLPAGDYTVTVTPPAGATNTGDPDGGFDSTADLTLGDGESNLDQDFGYQYTGQIGDTIWEDLDGDGVQDAGEPGIPGVTVELDPPPGVDLGNGPGVPVTVVTDANGEYLFDNLPPADYTINVTPPAGMDNTGDPDGGNDSTADLTLDPGESNLDQDFGYQHSGQIGDTIWQDTDGDGVQDPGEPGIPGVTVTLDPPAGVDLGNGPGVPVTVVTDANGEYLFDNLPAGAYTVTVTPPAGMTNTGDPDGGFDSTADLTLDPGESNLDQDFGYQPTFTVCPVGADNRWTDILGVGMGSTTKHKTQAKINIPNSGDVLALYGQMVAKDTGQPKYVRFSYPGKNNFVEVHGITSPSPRTYATFWYGTDLDPAANIRARWFLQPSGTKNHIPRAFLLYPTYETGAGETYVDVSARFDAADTQVYWDVTGGWIPVQVVEIPIPASPTPATFHVKVALVDNDKDARPIYVTASAGGISQRLTPTSPNQGDQLNILEFTLANVPANTGTIVLTIASPQPFTDGLGALGGDSGSLVGATANYACID